MLRDGGFLQGKTPRSHLIFIERLGINYMSFSDVPLFYGNEKQAGGLQLSGFTRNVTCAFFDRFLKGESPSRLNKVVFESQVGTVSVFAHQRQKINDRLSRADQHRAK
jgi:hypothetical protein